MLIVTLAFLVCIIGLVMYLTSEKSKVAEVGRVMFWTGLLSILLTAGPVILTLINHRP
jgi:Na+/phosphate symporter